MTEPCPHHNTEKEIDALGPMVAREPGGQPLADVEGWSLVCTDCRTVLSVHGRKP